jgi:hypothetical protein
MWRRAPAPVQRAVEVGHTNAGVQGFRGDPRQGLRDVVDWLQGARDSQAARQVLGELRTRLAQVPREVAAETIIEFLESGVDAASRLGFSIGGDGFLTEAPSLRVFLLDYLAQVDPRRAAEYAVRLLASLTTPEEWAVGLRNYARMNDSPAGRDFARRKLEQMLRHEPWRGNASVGFLEAFDVAVFAGGTELVGVLGELARTKENPAVAHAAFLALDRLVLREPEPVLALLQAQPGWLQGREETRANFFARADVSDPAQQRVLETYLLDPARSPAELEAFAGVFPNANYMISPNLLTRTVPPDQATLAQRDRAALRVLQGWMGEARFERVKPQLQRVERRLRELRVER